MSQQYRHDGRFARKKEIERRFKVAAVRRSLAKTPAARTPSICSGRRIVELEELGENLTCIQCNKTLSLKNIISEKRLGLNSILKVMCADCNVPTTVPTGKMHVTQNYEKFSDVNTKAVLGKFYIYLRISGMRTFYFLRQCQIYVYCPRLLATSMSTGTVRSGSGCTGLNNLLAIINIPPVFSDLYGRYEREVGPMIETAAKDSCKRATLEERHLVMEKIDDLRKEL